ncbi:hypothetical protein IJS77_05465 [bacterium]|nr:hypothetical protein [bacterium]
MSTFSIIIFIIFIVVFGITAMIFSDEIEKSPHPKCANSKTNVLIDFLYVCLIFFCGFFIIGNKLIKYIKKKSDKVITLEEDDEYDYEDEIDISMTKSKKPVAYVIIGLIIATIVIPVIFILIYGLPE